VWNRIRENVRAIATEYFDVTVEQFHVLRHIRKGAGSVSELAEVRQISRPAISQAVDVLVDKGLITRQQDTVDRRHVHLTLTPEGNAMLNTIFQKNRTWMEEKMASLNSEELASISRALSLLKVTFDDSSY
jgi:DNA-binding MarR family transcriptional regulator